MKVYSESGHVLFHTVHQMASFYERLIGVSRLNQILRTDAFYFERCSSVHMFGVKMAIDVIFLDKNATVTKVAPSLRPWQFSGSRYASAVLEVAEGMSQRLDIRVGQTLIIK